MHPAPPPYAMLDNNQYYANGAYPYHRNVPRYPNHHKGSCCRSCCRCICCCCCFLFLLIVIQVIILFSFYHIYNPQIPTYTVENLEVKSLNMRPDNNNLNTEVEVTVRAENPNKKIGFIYREDSSINITFLDTNLCSGNLPAFHQGWENTTIMKIDLKGETEFDPLLQKKFMDSQKSHRIPLDIKVRAPVSVVLGDIPLREFKVLVNCSVVVDNLSPNRSVNILSKETSFGIET